MPSQVSGRSDATILSEWSKLEAEVRGRGVETCSSQTQLLLTLLAVDPPPPKVQPKISGRRVSRLSQDSDGVRGKEKENTLPTNRLQPPPPHNHDGHFVRAKTRLHGLGDEAEFMDAGAFAASCGAGSGNL